jgi:hypothetical protein
VSGLSEYRRCESSASHRLKSARCHRLGAPHGLSVDLDLRRFGLGLLLGRHLEHACGDVNRNRDDPRPELVQEDCASAIAIARIPRVCFDLNLRRLAAAKYYGNNLNLYADPPPLRAACA